MGQDPSDEEIFDMIAAVDEDGSNEIGARAVPCAIRVDARRGLTRVAG